MIFILLKCVSGHNFHQIGLICQKNPKNKQSVHVHTDMHIFLF